MNYARTLMTLAALLTATATAQTKPPAVTYAPVTIDGTATKNGLVTVDGKTYVSLDALKAKGLTVLTPGALGLYAYPRGTGPAIKLTGCKNEWLNNGIIRFRVVDATATAEGWTASYESQISTSDLKTFPSQAMFDENSVLAVTSAGQSIDPERNPLQTVYAPYVELTRGTTSSGQLQFSDANGTGGTSLNRLTIRGTKQMKSSAAMNIDLTCTK